MNKLLRLFYDFSVYKELITEKFRYSLLRYSVAYLCLSLILGIWINHKYLPDVISTYQKISAEILQQIPQDARLELQNGILTTANLPSPYTLSLSSQTATPILHINSQADLTSLASTSAIIALGSTHMRALTHDDNTYEVMKYSDQKNLKSLSLSGNDFHVSIRAISQFIDHNRVYFPLFLTLPIFCFLWFERFIQTLMYALILRVFGSLFSNTYRFVHYWQLTLHTIIVAELINTLILVTYNTTYSYIFTIAYIGTTILVYLNLPNKNPNG